MQVSEKVVKVMAGEQISPAELEKMLQLAAKTSLRGMNRRYHHWLFRVDGNQLQDMQRTDMVTFGAGNEQVLEEHDVCDGEGCHECGWVGEVSVRISDSTAAALDARRF